MTRQRRPHPTPIVPATISPNLYQFYLANHRLPRLGDPQAPWSFKGWSLPYLLEAEQCFKLPPRWDYYFRTLQAGRLLPEPIPQIRFLDMPDPSVLRALDRWLRIIETRHTSWHAFTDLVHWLAWALGVAPDASKLEDELQARLYREVNLIPLLQAPHDYLGTYLADQRGNRKHWNPTAFFPSPHTVVRLMVQLTIDTSLGGDEDPRLRSVTDPALGTARFLLEASNYSLVLSGNDVDPLILAIAKINGALYAPWMSFPFPDTITKPDPNPTT